MSRPAKQGLDYFPIVCDPEDKVEYLEAKHGIVGFGVLIKLWTRIYKQHGYWCDWSEKSEIFFSKEVGISLSELREILATCFEENLFNREKYEKYKVLTSSGVQKRWIFISRNSKRKNCIIDAKLIINSFSIKPPEETGIYSRVNASFPKFPPEEMPQRKVKDSNSTKAVQSLESSNIPNSDTVLLHTSYAVESDDSTAEKKQKIVGVVSVEKKKKKSGAKKENGPNEKIFNLIKSAWWGWFMSRNKNVAPKFDGSHGRAIKMLVKHLLVEGQKKHFADETMLCKFAEETFSDVLNRWNELKQDKFLYSCVDIRKISSYWNDIINFLNHGTGKRNSPAGSTTGTVGKTIEFDKP